MVQPPVRTITIGIAEPHPVSREVIVSAARILQEARQRYRVAGYEVQTLRLSMRPLLRDVSDRSDEEIRQYVKELQYYCEEVGIENCSLGTVDVSQPDFPVERLNLVADLIIATRVFSMTVLLATSRYGLRAAAALPVAQIIKRLAHETDEGFGNFRFAMLACVEAGSPFFPAAYHVGPANLMIGMQGAGIVGEALKKMGADGKHPLDLRQITRQVREDVVACATPIIKLARHSAQQHGLQFGGIDVSPAPMGEESIVAAMESCGYGLLGDAGTLAVAAALTEALKSTELPTCGYNGLMLPVLEDAILGKRWEERHVNAHQLLLYSAVCGTGLDTIPLPGSSAEQTIAHLLLDVATLALRYQKPLSARLFPVPGKRAGERTNFTSPYLTNTCI